MTHVLDYALPPPASAWRRRWGAAVVACVPGAASIVEAGVLSTVAMRSFQWREGLTILNGSPDEDYFQLWIETIPYLLATGLLAVTWLWAVRRAGRGDRLPVALAAAVLLGGLWCVAVGWIFHNGQIAIP